ncbi:hypothetical protein PEPS_43360 (plasmid) [Persicobacter psychrovividus]|uniref:Uncharacterized protein n=1 Tax=Persicobacter psychrovividus TaxID=387638 RepID=A0ABN6LFV5_9BACT|nr:hypothetical protein PEPS_43360 [Persicobacter psychrovividus]
MFEGQVSNHLEIKTLLALIFSKYPNLEGNSFLILSY